MTVLASSELRGWFEPITLGLHAPTDFEELRKYPNDDVSIPSAAAFVHELSHYLQFYGTVFGYSYLLGIRACSVCMQDAMKSMTGRKGLSFPASSWPIDIDKVFPTQEDREFYTQAILMNRYYNEELSGYTYPHFGRNHPVRINGHSVLTSPLYLELADGTTFPFTGEVLLENYAVCQEVQFLSRSTSCKKYVDTRYLSLSNALQVRYMGIGVWFGTFGLTQIEPLLYFVLLNQPQEGFLRRLGDYTLACNTKKLLTESTRLKELPRPKTNEETRYVMSKIADISGLADPLDVLSKWKDLLKPSIEGNPWPVDWISYRIWDWFLEQPLRILTWPENLQSVLTGLPLVKVHFDNRTPGESINLLNVPQGTLSSRHFTLLEGHHDYSERVYMITGLYNHSEIRCPHLWDSKPQLCESCQACRGHLPDDGIGDDCPVTKKHGDLINIVSKKK